MKKFCVFLVLIVVFISFCSTQDEEETSPDPIPDIVTPTPKGKSEYQKTLKFDPLKCTIDPPPNLKELEVYYEWMDKHGRKWKNAEERMCKMIRVINNMRDIEEHNERFNAGEETFTRALWDGSDLTLEEKHEKFAMKNVKDFKWRSLPVPTAPFPTALPSVNHTASGLVTTPVRNQGGCNSCYAFGAIAALEGQVRKCGISTEKLSEQSIVDCSTLGTSGCYGGWPYWAYNWMMSTGIMTDASYPYTATQSSCNYNSSSIIGYVDGAYNYNSFINETFMREAVSAVGPVAVVMCLDSAFYSYSAGVFRVSNCCTSIQHVVTIVGYGFDPFGAGSFWIAKNSWGSGWGERGFFRIQRGTNMCIIESQFSYPSVRKRDGTLCP